MAQVTTTESKAAEQQADAVVVGVYAQAELSGGADEINEATGGLLSRLIESGEITGKPNEVVPLLGLQGVAAGQVVVAGLGEREKFDRGQAYRATAAATRALTSKKRKRIAYFLDDGWSGEQVEAAVAASVFGSQGADLYRAEKNLHEPEEIVWATSQATAVDSGKVLGASVNLTRRLVDEPPEEIYPESFAKRAAEVAGESGLECEIWDEKRLQQERAGALLAVAKGSARPPRLVILRHQGGGAGDVGLALVGKGVTFDSGGLSLKPNESMKTMKCDMAGAATVLGAMQAIGQLQLPVNVIGVMGLVENMPSGTAMKLGDVLHARNGRTIEVQNTDAEGRLVLADALAVAVDLGAARLIDLATLTGACVVALGTDVAGLMTNDEPWCEAVAAAAASCGERAWQLPMFPEYSDLIKSEVADIRNTGEGRWGGAITAAKFLEEFVDQKPWTHIDIAGPAYADKSQAWQGTGATGAMVRTLVEVVRRMG